jgi:hypothetical protein
MIEDSFGKQSSQVCPDHLQKGVFTDEPARLV